MRSCRGREAQNETGMERGENREQKEAKTRLLEVEDVVGVSRAEEGGHLGSEYNPVQVDMGIRFAAGEELEGGSSGNEGFAGTVVSLCARPDSTTGRNNRAGVGVGGAAGGRKLYRVLESHHLPWYLQCWGVRKCG